MAGIALCNHVVAYSAYRAGDYFIVIASGSHPQPGWQTQWIEINPQRCPPDLAFTHDPPVPPAPPAAVTTFVKCTKVYYCKASTRTEVAVADGNGAHAVPIAIVPNLPMCPDTLVAFVASITAKVRKKKKKKSKKRKKK